MLSIMVTVAVIGTAAATTITVAATDTAADGAQDRSGVGAFPMPITAVPRAAGTMSAFGEATGYYAGPGAATNRPAGKQPAKLLPLAHVDEVARDRGGGRHRGRHQMRAASIALAAFEVAV